MSFASPSPTPAARARSRSIGRIGLLLLIGVLAVVLAACGSDDTETEAGSGDTDTSLPTDDGGSGEDGSDDTASGGAAGGGATRPWIAGDWVLQSATGPDGPLDLPPGIGIDLRITGPDSIEGNAGCNSFGGTISAPFDDDADAGPLALSELFLTEMACEFLDVETIYVDLLLAADRWELAPPTGLVFRGEGIELVYGIGEPPAAVPLEGTMWVFDTIFDGEGVERTASTPRADKPTVTAVVADGVVTLSSEDCEFVEVAVDYDAGASDGPFTVGDAPAVDCADPESNLLPALDGVIAATGFQIVDGRLTLIGLPGETVSFVASDG